MHTNKGAIAMIKNTFPQNADRIVTIPVDLQNDFCPGGSLAVTNGDQVIDPMNRIMQYTHDRGGIVAATRDWHPAQTPHFDTWQVHCVTETEGARFHKRLDMNLVDYIISKGTGQTDGYSGFEGADRYELMNGEPFDFTLEKLIQPKTARERVAVIIGGLATDYCVKATALDAAKQADRVRAAKQGVIDVYIAEDAIRAVNIQPDDGAGAIAEMRAAGIIITTSTDIVNETVGIEIES